MANTNKTTATAKADKASKTPRTIAKEKSALIVSTVSGQPIPEVMAKALRAEKAAKVNGNKKVAEKVAEMMAKTNLTASAAIAEVTKAEKPAKAPKAAKAPAEDAPKAFDIHINKTGRICFGKHSAARIEGTEYMMLIVKDGLLRFKPVAEQDGTAWIVRWAGSRPYVSATPVLKELGFDGTAALDFEADAVNGNGLVIRWGSGIAEGRK